MSGAARASCLLVFLHVILVGWGAYIHFPSRNEVAHIPAGLAVWETGTFHLYRVNPPLPRMVATLPLLATNCDTASLRPSPDPTLREEWDAARRFADANPFHYLALVRLSRVMGIVWSVLGAYLIWRWASELYGPQGGLIGVGIWCLGPTVNAHAQMVTPDLPAAVAGLGATYLFRSYLHSGSWASASYAGFALGGAQLCKFTLLVLYPAWVGIALAYLLLRSDNGFRRQGWKTRLGQMGFLFALSATVINLGYLCDGTFTPLGEYEFVSRSLGGEAAHVGKPGNRFIDSPLAALSVPLPADYLSGIDLQRRDFESGWESFLAGERSKRGWWYYYLYAMGVKTPLAVLVLVAWGVVLTVLRHRASAPLVEELCLWMPCLSILAMVSSQGGINSHSRYVLPALPFAVVVTGKLGYFLGRRREAIVVAGLTLWAVVSVFRIYPHTLSYFNESVGGPDRGHEHLIDSNIDWGQDLLLLKWWVERHPEQWPVSIGYNNLIDYRHAGFELPPAPKDTPLVAISPEEWSLYGPRPGVFAIDIDGLTEGKYRFFSQFTPFDKIGYSIFLYRITPDQAAEARVKMGLPALDRDGLTP